MNLTSITSVIVPLVTGSLVYLFGWWNGRREGYARARRVDAAFSGHASPASVSYDITINFAGKPEDHPDLRADIVKIIESATRGGAS